MFVSKASDVTRKARSSRLGGGNNKACCRNLKTTTRPGHSDPIRARGRRPLPAVDADALKPGTLARRLRPEEGARVGRRRHRLRGAPPDPRPARRGQGAAPAARGVAADGRALRAGSARRQHDQAPEHRRHLRVRRSARRAAVLRHGAARGHRPAVDPERARPLSARRGAGDPRAGLLGAAGGARPGHRPPRPQGQQHLHRQRAAASASSSCSTSASRSCCTPTRARAG